MRARFQRDFGLTLCLFLLSIATVWADAENVAEEASRAATVVTDTPAAQLDPQEVARELLRLQEEMGGSIISDLDTTPPSTESPQAFRRLNEPQGARTWRVRDRIQNTVPPEVKLLRETVWQLEQSAHLLEMADLYDQADTLRKTADKLRADARWMRKASYPPSEPSQSDVTSRHD